MINIILCLGFFYMLYYNMGTDQIIMCVVALLLGMLLANMLKSVCGCKTVEGQHGGNPTVRRICLKKGVVDGSAAYKQCVLYRGNWPPETSGRRGSAGHSSVRPKEGPETRPKTPTPVTDAERRAYGGPPGPTAGYGYSGR